MTYPPHIQTRLLYYAKLANEERFALDREMQEELNRQMRLYGTVRGDLYERVVPADSDFVRRFYDLPFRLAPFGYVNRKLFEILAEAKNVLIKQWVFLFQQRCHKSRQAETGETGSEAL